MQSLKILQKSCKLFAGATRPIFRNLVLKIVYIYRFLSITHIPAPVGLIFGVKEVDSSTPKTVAALAL